MNHGIALKKSLLIVWGLLTLMLLAACNSDSKLINSNADLRGTVTLYIVDVNTGLPVDQVIVEIVGVGDKKTQAGEVSFGDVKAGAYFVRLSKKGYQTTQHLVEVETAGTETVVAVNVSLTLPIYKLGASVRGRVLVRNAAGDSTVPADSVTVHLWSEPGSLGSFPAAMRTTVTSSDGWYTFDTLAEFSAYAVEVPQFLYKGRAYQLEPDDIGNGNLTSGSQVFTAAPTILTPATGGALTAFARSTRLVKGQPVLIEFSNPVDTSKLVTSPTASILLRMTTVGTVSIGASLSWNSTFTALSILPYQSDWIDGATYAVNFSALRDIYGGTLTGNVTGLSVPAAIVPLTAVQNLRVRATTTIRGTPVDTTIVDYMTTPYLLRWSRVAAAEGYSVYYRQSTDSAWQLRATTLTNLSTDTSLTLTPVATNGKAWRRYIMVLPNSSTRLVPFSLGATLTISDGVKPSLNVGTTLGNVSAAGGSFNNTAGPARVITVTVPTVLTNTGDILDTTKRPLIRVGNNTATSAGTFTAPSFVWTSLTTGTLTATVAANTNALNDTLIIDFAPVTDLAGNLFDNLPAAPVVRYVVP